MGKLFDVLLKKLFVLLNFVQENKSLLFAGTANFIVAYVEQLVQIKRRCFCVLDNVLILEICGHEMLKSGRLAAV